MRIDIVTLFPGMITPVLAESMVGRAQTRGLVDIRVVNLQTTRGAGTESPTTISSGAAAVWS